MRSILVVDAETSHAAELATTLAAEGLRCERSHHFDLASTMTTISNVMDGIIFTDREAKITLLNPVAEDLIGAKAFMAMGRTMAELSGHQELIEPLRTDHAQIGDGVEANRTVELHHSEQDLLYIRAVTTQVTDYRSEFAGILTVLQDVTVDYKSDQLRNQYLSIVAHELRTPLTGIKTFSTMMAKSVLGDLNNRQQDAVEAIREQSLRLEHQIDKLINLGYLDAHDYAQDLEVFDADEFLVTVAAPFGRPAVDRGVTLEIDCPPGLRLQADRADLKRALQALLENALKFTPQLGRVEISAAAVENGKIRFSVRDEGIGVAPRYRRRIFERFFQVEDPLTRRHGGAGLGLFVAAQILAAHGSEVEVESELGKGAEFSFCLPTYEESCRLGSVPVSGDKSGGVTV